MFKHLRIAVVNAGVLGEFLTLLWERKRWWLIPMVLILMLLGVVFIFAPASPIGPFIYTLF